MDINRPYSIVVLSGEYIECEEDGTLLLHSGRVINLNKSDYFPDNSVGYGWRRID